MNLEDLQSILNAERQADSVQPLPGSFYEEVGTHLAELRAERERVAADRGFDDPEFRRLSDEIDAAEDTVESIYERRVGKIVKAASIAASGMPADDEGLTDEERALFETLVAEIADNRERVLDVLDEGTPASDPADPEPPAEGDRRAVPPSDPPPDAGADPDDDGDRSPPDDPGPEDDEAEGLSTDSEADVSRTMIQITRDVGEILGVDERAYDLARGDVVTLPAANAGPLLDRDAAERLE